MEPRDILFKSSGRRRIVHYGAQGSIPRLNGNTKPSPSSSLGSSLSDVGLASQNTSPNNSSSDESSDPLIWEDYFQQLSSEDKNQIHEYVTWKILIPICIFTFLRTFRPGNSFFLYYLTNFKGVEESLVNNLFLGLKVGCYLIMMAVFAYVNTKVDYRYIVPIELLCQIVTRILFIFCNNSSVLWVGYLTYGIAIGGETILYLYRTNLVQDTHKLLITSVSSFTLFLSMFLSGLVSQVILGFGVRFEDPSKFHLMFFISIASISLALLIAMICLPSIDQGLVYGPPTDKMKCLCSTFPGTDDTRKEIKVNEFWSRIKSTRSKSGCDTTQESKGLLSSSSKSNETLESTSKCYACVGKMFCDTEDYSNTKTLISHSDDSPIWPYPENLDSKDCGYALKYMFLRKDGLFWAILWSALMVAQYSTDGDLSSNWLDAYPESSYNGLAEALGSLTAACGALVPPFVDRCYKSGSKRQKNAEDDLHFENHIWVASICTFIAVCLIIAQFVSRNIIHLYVINCIYQAILNVAITVASSHLTIAFSGSGKWPSIAYMLCFLLILTVASASQLALRLLTVERVPVPMHYLVYAGTLFVFLFIATVIKRTCNLRRESI